VNCDTIHRRLLSLERPDQPPADVRGHLASCDACRGWHKRLMEMEARVARLAVPPPQRKKAFLDSLRQPAPPPSTIRFQPDRRAQRPALRDRGRLKLAIAVAGAAALVLIALGVAAWPHGQRVQLVVVPQRLSPLKQRLKEDARWAKARTPQEKLAVLSDLADETHAQAQKLAQAKGESFDREVDLYREIVERITSKEATQIDKKERVKVLQPLAERLARAESQANTLADSMALDSPAVPPLRELVAIAHRGNQQIRALIQEAAA
jgi:hypothetical protein